MRFGSVEIRALRCWSVGAALLCAACSGGDPAASGPRGGDGGTEMFSMPASLDAGHAQPNPDAASDGSASIEAGADSPDIRMTDAAADASPTAGLDDAGMGDAT